MVTIKSIEEKAKRYDEAYKVAENIHRFSSDPAEIKRMEQISPALAESDDERIRKAILGLTYIDGIEPILTKCSVTRQDIRAYLEKQGLQKPVEPTDLKTWKYIVDAVLTEREGIGQYIDSPWTTDVAKKLQKRFGNIEQKPAWSEEDEELMKWSINNLTELKDRFGEEYGKVGDCIDWLKSLKDRVQPKQEWSEEDETNYNRLLHFLNGGGLIGGRREELVSWLKSLRPQNKWKPSDEQMEALDFAADCIVPAEFCFKRKALKELYKDLKKLKK